ncbi:MAG: tRNA pseudouridine(38-40) synthase TruA [Alphaproteobacteria bacterium]|nr:tRNA pseudouridine(38-40) synthase TruA [Alphaproteobacteria bacterium]OJV15353.1 MAG: tRNA pseudouridine(38-40) synthase TruA [Alphaproteobacteria bacterium 33-17]
MIRYKITIEYKGTRYYGWQIQPGLPTVQEEIEKAIFAFSHYKAEVYGSGRTDKGVHATGQVAHFDLPKEYDTHKLVRSINHFLQEEDIVVLDCEKVESDFHARYSAIRRTYQYRIINRSSPSAIYKNLSWVRHLPLDPEKMQEGANVLIGHHDFTSFRATMCQAKSPIITVDNIRIISENYPEIIIEVSARSFLHHMVRNIVGTLRKVGEGELTPKDVQNILDAKNRAAAEMTAPADGLFLCKVDYS